MMTSLSTTAQLTNSGSFNAASIMNYRAALKTVGQGLDRITINDIILYAVAHTLKNHKILNAHLVNDEMHYFGSVNLGIAVDTDRGLMVPTLFGADMMTLKEISENAKNLIKTAQSGSISPDLLQGASFTVTNLGTLGVEHFTPVINPPQTGILGVCSIIERIRTSDGKITAYPAMGLSLTYDHRAVDGAPAAKFIQELKANLEDFPAFISQ